MPELEAQRLTGKVVRILGEYGFVASDSLPGQDLYFKVAWFRGALPLAEGETVTFQTKTYGENVQARFLSRPGEERPELRGPSRPGAGRLLDWAYFGYLPNVLGELQGLALKERWEFSRVAADAAHPLPILWSYLRQTFARLVLENKVLVNDRATFGAFNTGLVDSRYEPIHALFTPQNDPRASWQLAGFCIPGEGADGQNLVRHFSPLPAPAHYFDQSTDLLYDARAGKPELSWNHVVIDRIDRYPTEFIEDHWPTGFERRDERAMSLDQRKAYFAALGKAIEADKRIYRRIMSRVRDAVDLSIKRVSWNFKTAVPQYYPPVRKLQLLLPLALMSDDTPDLALAVEKTQSGSYLAHTVLPLDWAYSNARLICRPDSDWLDPSTVIESTAIDEAEAGI
jgi:hypothetical protein